MWYNCYHFSSTRKFQLQVEINPKVNCWKQGKMIWKLLYQTQVHLGSDLIDQPESPDSSESPNLCTTITRSVKIQNSHSLLCLISNRIQSEKLLYPGSVVPLAMLLSPAGELGLHCLCFLQFDYLPGWGWVVLCKWKVWDVLVWPGGGGQVRAESFLSECVTLLHWHPDITLSHTTLMDWHRQLQIWIQNRNHSGARTPCQSLFLLWDLAQPIKVNFSILSKNMVCIKVNMLQLNFVDNDLPILYFWNEHFVISPYMFYHLLQLLTIHRWQKPISCIYEGGWCIFANI